MERNTLTTLGELKEGDRFHYPGKKKDVWQVISNLRQRAEVNQIEFGKRLHKYNTIVKNETKVVFLRNTYEKL